MNKLILLCLISTFTFIGAHAEIPVIPQMGELITSVQRTAELGFGGAEMRDKDLIVYAREKEGRILIFDQSGQKKKDLPNINGLIALRNGGFVGSQYLSKPPMEPTYSIFNQEGIPKAAVAGRNQVYKQLRDGSIAVSRLDSDPYLTILDSDGKVRSQLKGIQFKKMDEFRDGTLVYSNNKELRFIGRDWKPKATHVFPEAGEYHTIGKPYHNLPKEEKRIMSSYLYIRHLLVSKSELFLLGFQNKLYFYDSSGKEISRFTSELDPNSLFVGATEFPDGELFVNCTDGMSYIFDKEGKLKAKHQHDSKTVTAPVYAGKNLVVFQNSTELVFVDKEGKEKGVLPIPRIIHWSINPHNLFSPEEGSIIIHDLHFLHFIKF